MDGKPTERMTENPLEILDRPEVVSALKKHWAANHENLADPKRFVEQFFTHLSEKRKENDPDIRGIKKFYNKKLEEQRRGGRSLLAGRPKDMFLEIIDAELSGAETVLDFGCGKLAFLKELADGNKKIKKMIGVDPKSRPVLEGLDPRIEFQRGLGNIENESVDLAVIKLVLHHLGNEAEILGIFGDIKNILRPGGKLVIFEESFPESNCDTGEIRSYLAEFHMELSEATEDFLCLSKEERISFLFLNDWLMNVQNSYMPWTMQYKSMEEWKKLGETAGFKEKESHFLGAIKHRKRKQGMTAYIVFEK